ncbi:MAG: AAA-like domain-containing protein [Nostoc sp. NMS1]|nr:AAA-like domain-containing protein [Nostoc sp. NMS1]MBN3994059.1 AAA-like domain-containing protein [Nostoc sp. NMS2]
MNSNQAFWIANNQVKQTIGKELQDVDYYILQGAWEGLKYIKIYDIIKEKLDISTIDSIQKYFAPNLFRDIKSAFSMDKQETIGLRNFKEIMEQQSMLLPREPTDVLPLDSPFYIEQSSLDIFDDSLIRIKASRKMGKTSFIIRLIEKLEKQNYQAVHLKLSTFDQESFHDLNRFLRELSYQVSTELGLVPQLNEYFITDVRPTYGCQQYFEKYLLKNLNKNLVLIFDEVDRLFKYSEMKDFFNLLRNWKELANFSNSKVWQRLYLVLIYSTDPYLELDLNQSPFENVGRTIILPPFTFEQLKELAIRRYQLRYLTDTQLQELQQMLGGHPYLVQLALWHLFKTDLNTDIPFERSFK